GKLRRELAPRGKRHSEAQAELPIGRVDGLMRAVNQGVSWGVQRRRRGIADVGKRLREARRGKRGGNRGGDDEPNPTLAHKAPPSHTNFGALVDGIVLPRNALCQEVRAGPRAAEVDIIDWRGAPLGCAERPAYARPLPYRVLKVGAGPSAVPGWPALRVNILLHRAAEIQSRFVYISIGLGSPGSRHRSGRADRTAGSSSGSRTRNASFSCAIEPSHTVPSGR